MMLSIGIMMKNEEKYIGMCLEGLLPIVEKLDAEIIIIDTGSTDNSIEIAKKYTDKVYSYDWNNDFSEIRNKLISLSKGEWYMSVDADEILVNADDIINFFLSDEYKNYNGATVKIKSFADTSKENFSINDLNRIFKKDKDFKYMCSVHEQPVFKNPTKVLQSVFDHYGYLSDDKALMERKFKRNIKLLKKEAKKDPKNIYINLQLGVTYSMHKEYEKALKVLERNYKMMKERDKKIHKQMFIEYSNVLIANNRLYEAKRICQEGMRIYREDMQYKIDLSYNIANISLIEKNYEDAIEYYHIYFDLLDKWENGELKPDNTITTYKTWRRNKALREIVVAFYRSQEYENVIEYSYKIHEENEFILCIEYIINSFIKVGDFEGLYNFYNEKVVDLSQTIQILFIKKLEEQKINLNKNEKDIITKFFANNEKFYGKYNKFIEDSSEQNLNILISEMVNIECRKNNISFIGQILFIALKNNYSIENLFGNLNCKTILEFIEECNSKFKEEFCYLINQYVKYDGKNDFNSVKIKMLFCKSILILDDKKDNEYKEIFRLYLDYSFKYMKSIYSECVINNCLINEVKDNEHEFILYMYRAEEIKKTNKKDYISYLRKALKAYPAMKRAIEQILKETEKLLENKSSEMDLLKNKLIENIEFLIKNNKIDEAKNIIEQFKLIVGETNELKMLESNLIRSL